MMMMDIFGKPTNSEQFFNPGNSGLKEEEEGVEQSSLLDTVAKLPVSLKTAASNFGEEKYLDVNVTEIFCTAASFLSPTSNVPASPPAVVAIGILSVLALLSVMFIQLETVNNNSNNTVNNSVNSNRVNNVDKLSQDQFEEYQQPDWGDQYDFREQLDYYELL